MTAIAPKNRRCGVNAGALNAGAPPPPASAPRGACRRAGAARLGEALEQRHGVVPADAGVGDALAVRERLARHEVLAALDCRCDSTITPMIRRSPAAIWRADVGADLDLALVAACGCWRASSRSSARSCSAGAPRARRRRRRRSPRRSSAAAPPRRMMWQSSLPRVSTIADLAALVDREEMVRLRGGEDRVDRDPHVAVGAVLEADRRRQARGQLAVHLRSRWCARRSRPS